MSYSRREFLSRSLVGAGLFAGHDFFGALAEAAEDQKATSPFLVENFGPVREETTAGDLKVIGRLPGELDGMYVRNGPNPQFPPKLNYHWFDGDGMLHGVRIRDGKASYRNRWVRTTGWTAENKAGKAIYPSVLDPPDFAAIVKKAAQGDLPFPNRANTALVLHHGKLLALWEGGPPHEIKVPKLETIGSYDFGGRLKHPFTAHPKVDPKTGEMMFFGYSPFKPHLVYSVADRTGKIVCTTPIDLPRAVMMHDMAITKSHSVFIDCPYVFDAVGPLRGKPFFEFQPKHGARIGVLPRHAKKDDTQWFEIGTCFVFHVFNAHEEGDEIVLHACRFPEYPKFADLANTVNTDNFEKLFHAASSVAYRWRLNLKTGRVTESKLDDRTSEFPRVNDDLAGRKSEFGYSLTGTSRGSSFLKYDFDTAKRQRHDLGEGRSAGEGVFVSRQDAKSEDDGWLVSFVYDRAEERSELVVVDCLDFKSPPVARILIPQRVPYGFHGLWLPGAAL